MKHIDTIIIGSGAGGLSAALALARAGQKGGGDRAALCARWLVP